MKAPAFYARKNPTWQAALLAPAAALYGAVVKARWRCAGPKPPRQNACPVLCVGNVVAGGAGKTPTALALLDLLISLGENPSFVSRGYGGRTRGPLLVDPAKRSTREVGDEPLLLSRAAPTWIGKNRPATLEKALGSGASCLILDDGLQNPRLFPDLSFLVLDGPAGLGNGKLLPAGPLREPLDAAAARAHAVILIGPDEAGLAKRFSLPVFRARLAPQGGEYLPKDKPYLAFAGIGRPEKFFTTCRQAGLTLDETVSFPDHHAFSPRELEALAARARAHGAHLLTTEKDSVRLPTLWRERVLTLGVRLLWENPEELAAFLQSSMRALRRPEANSIPT